MYLDNEVSIVSFTIEMKECLPSFQHVSSLQDR